MEDETKQIVGIGVVLAVLISVGITIFVPGVETFAIRWLPEILGGSLLVGAIGWWKMRTRKNKYLTDTIWFEFDPAGDLSEHYVEPEWEKTRIIKYPREDGTTVFKQHKEPWVLPVRVKGEDWRYQRVYFCPRGATKALSPSEEFGIKEEHPKADQMALHEELEREIREGSFVTPKSSPAIAAIIIIVGICLLIGMMFGPAVKLKIYPPPIPSNSTATTAANAIMQAVFSVI